MGIRLVLGEGDLGGREEGRVEVCAYKGWEVGSLSYWKGV